jgi:DNA polymerase/3'-5' exonuclease PolX
LWSLLGSKERNGLKKLAKAKQEKLKEMGLATQP